MSLPRLLAPALVALTLAAPACAAELPGFMRAALAALNPDPPPGWACTLTTRRGDQVSVERFDPARPAGHEWSLVQFNGRPATADEADRYDRYRVTTNATAPHPVFKRGDIDTGSARLVRETDHEAEYAFRFREGLPDALLAHLELRVAADKARGVPTRCRLVLTAPFSPVLALKIEQLDLTTTLAAEPAGGPVLPRQVRSLFHARFLFFKSIDEDLRIAYSDFKPPPRPAAAGPSGN